VIFYDQNKEHVLKSLHSSEDGISTEQATQRLHQYGYNIINIKGESWFRKLFEPFKSIFIAILAVAAALSIFKNEILDAAIIITIIMVSAIIYYVQRFSTERVLRALKKHDAQLVRVWRDGDLMQLDSEVLVPGDVIELTEGEKVPADCRVLHSENARVDEALLTGESEPVAKHSAPLQSDRPIYEQTNMLFQGSFVVSGNVKAVVVETGNTTEFGRLAQLAGNTHIESPVQQKIDKLITAIIGSVFIISIVVFVLNIIRGYDASEALRFMIALAVSSVPEGLPIAISVILVLGMHRMAKKNALVRSMSAIENIGLVTMIATDKTGTLTKNKLSVQDVWELKPKSDLHDIAGAIHKSVVHSKSGTSYDPLDEAFIAFSHEYKAESDINQDLIKVLPFDQKHAMSGALWKRKSDKMYETYIKGAPEKILAASDCTPGQIKTIEHELHHLTGQGLRVIAIGCAKYHRPVNDFDEALTHKLEFIALIAVADELREEAPAAIHAAHQAGIEVAMITGDHAETAYAIGKQIGLLHHREEVFDSRKLDADHHDSDNLSHHVYRSKVFARVTPENKYKLLTLFKQKHITAMTGDGVNDVPALAQSHIGFAMGSGTQVAKEAGDIVLLDDNFSTIVTAIREGRTIFANIRRMLFYLLATTTGAVLTMLGALIIGLPLPALAVQILWINLVTDTALVIPLGLEPAESDLMKTPPRKPDMPILDRYLIKRILLVALTMAVSVLVVFVYFLQDYTVEYARTISFTVLVALQWANAFNARSDMQSAFSRLKVTNFKFAIGLTISVILQLLALFGPLANALHVVPVSVAHLVISSLIACSMVIFVAELHKLRCRKTQLN
jgi:P-type Ca2+ transporter type 2C